MVKSWFTELDSRTNVPTVSVINAHAPMNRGERFDYWRQACAMMDINTVLVGDMNKFPEDTAEYAKIFDGLQDHVDGRITFVSFDTDRNPQGELW
jgi:hypothetical protein